MTDTVRSLVAINGLWDSINYYNYDIIYDTAMIKKIKKNSCIQNTVVFHE